MKIKEQTRKLAATGCSKHCFEVDCSKHCFEVVEAAQSTALRFQIKLTWFEEIFEEYNMNLIYEARSYETWLQLEKGE
ncbi:hypothetical protein [Streptococcus pneumoniae]|uniref:hypothetical protein n=1 Tax=Streptococcus pneumoniae TaxID=1313 RepID=UPI00067C1F7D|nr:hypothetical protein [Streptococcus pneumoniae]